MSPARLEATAIGREGRRGQEGLLRPEERVLQHPARAAGQAVGCAACESHSQPCRRRCADSCCGSQRSSNLASEATATSPSSAATAAVSSMACAAPRSTSCARRRSTSSGRPMICGGGCGCGPGRGNTFMRTYSAASCKSWERKACAAASPAAPAPTRSAASSGIALRGVCCNQHLGELPEAEAHQRSRAGEHAISLLLEAAQPARAGRRHRRPERPAAKGQAAQDLRAGDPTASSSCTTSSQRIKCSTRALKSVLHWKEKPMGGAQLPGPEAVRQLHENISCCTSVAAVQPPIVRRTGGFLKKRMTVCRPRMKSVSRAP